MKFHLKELFVDYFDGNDNVVVVMMVIMIITMIIIVLLLVVVIVAVVLFSINTTNCKKAHYIKQTTW